MRSGTTLNMKCLWANWFGLRTSIKSGGLKTGKAIAFAIIASCLSLVVITPHRAIETVSAKTAAEERAERIEAALFTPAEFFGSGIVRGRTRVRRPSDREEGFQRGVGRAAPAKVLFPRREKLLPRKRG